jgi:hypothetical protein
MGGIVGQVKKEWRVRPSLTVDEVIGSICEFIGEIATNIHPFMVIQEFSVAPVPFLLNLAKIIQGEFFREMSMPA